jgi:hypothetical protein
MPADLALAAWDLRFNVVTGKSLPYNQNLERSGSQLFGPDKQLQKP